jgi:hypothetical protein
MNTKRLIAESLNPKRPTPAWKCLLIGIALLGAGIVAGEYWEVYRHANSPPTMVVSGFAAYTPKRVREYFSAHVIGRKEEFCIYVPDSQVGWAFDGIWREVPFKYLDDPTPNSTRPVGHQSFGIWQWKVREGDFQVKTTVKHDCNGHSILSTIGPFGIR